MVYPHCRHSRRWILSSHLHRSGNPMRSPCLSTFIYFTTCSARADLPASWHHGTILVKPGTRGQTPQNSDRLPLLEPTGKALLGTFSQHLLSAVAARLNRLPQFAYLPRRGAEDALNRLRNHCDLVRRYISRNRFQIHQQATGTTHYAVTGGLLLSLDLQRAFDTVLRSKLIAALRALNVDDSLILTFSVFLEFFLLNCFEFCFCLPKFKKT